MNINDAIKDYLNYITFEKGLSIRTKKSYENDLDIYYNFLKNINITNINDITNNHIKSFLKERSNESTKTIAHQSRSSRTTRLANGSHPCSLLCGQGRIQRLGSY